MELIKPGTSSGCSDLIEIIRGLSSIMKDDMEQPSPEVVRMASKSKPLLAPLLLNLFSTISNYWRCTCKSPHQAALLLFTNRTLPKNNTPACFTVLFSRTMIPRPIKRWHEAGITIYEQLPKPIVRIALPYSNRQEKSPVTDLCAVIKKSTTRLNLNIEGTSLSSQAETESQMENFKDSELVSFTKGFLENESELQIYEKVCLAVVLSYAFLDFCGRPWFPKGWTKDSLYLMQHERTLFLQPFLVTNMVPKQSEPKLPISVADARAEMLLLHGILLMEIFEQESLRASSKLDEKAASLKDMAQKWFMTIKWGVCERFRQAVGACIQGTLIDSAMISSTSCSQSRANLSSGPLFNLPEVSDEEFGRLFCERILAPIEADFKSQWQNKDPDEVMLTIKLPSVKQEPNTSPKPESTASKVCFFQQQVRVMPYLIVSSQA
ncbi:hypothetical protein NA56DRAFT_453965 [Hyaloscypha hepaticicola]|uniref:DUF7580 domain-containing protein n=1 Tax=Hyaloscypha hepaticicola TaxID=2082293 RepID=A0A2J6PFG9_9HELO|nr:hypothetical protein NA56DRAFT_453965 [Hyaloscypha hepaticicola]